MWRIDYTRCASLQQVPPLITESSLGRMALCVGLRLAGEFVRLTQVMSRTCAAKMEEVRPERTRCQPYLSAATPRRHPSRHFLWLKFITFEERCWPFRFISGPCVGHAGHRRVDRPLAGPSANAQRRCSGDARDRSVTPLRRGAIRQAPLRTARRRFAFKFGWSAVAGTRLH